MKENFQYKKSLGQHFLTRDVVPRWMCEAAELTADDLVLEIGPGKGILTKELLKSGARVLALEADQRAVDWLEEEFASELKSGQLQLQHADVRELDLNQLSDLSDHKYKVIANIPYYLSGYLFRTFLQTPIQPNTLVFLVQKEVARRATGSLAGGQKESLLSLSVQAYGKAKFVKAVGRGHFVPPPAVDSAIVAITNLNRHHFTDVDETAFFALLHIGFGQKRKQLLGNLGNSYQRDQLVHIFSTLGISHTVRAEDVDLKTWLRLAKALQSTVN